MKYHLISYHVKSLKEKLIKVIKDQYKSSKSTVQTALQALTYNYLDFEPWDYQTNEKKIKVTHNLTEIYVILKPDKGQGIMLIIRNTYTSPVEGVFKEESKFKKLNDDPTLINLKTKQNYLKTLLKWEEIQYIPDNSNLQGIKKIVRVIGTFDNSNFFR